MRNGEKRKHAQQRFDESPLSPTVHDVESNVSTPSTSSSLYVYRRAESAFSPNARTQGRHLGSGGGENLLLVPLKGSGGAGAGGRDASDVSYKSLNSSTESSKQGGGGGIGVGIGGGSKTKKGKGQLGRALRQLPAVLLGALLNLMWAIPFGVSYFPIEWKAIEQGPPTAPNSGAFPLPGKDALGIRIFLFSTLIGQFVFTFASKFKNAIGMQMIENVPFTQTLAMICISEQGWGVESLSTLFFIFGASSIVVGVVFFMLGYMQLGNVVYFIPNHVLLGCIGGIGVFIIGVAIEVTIDAPFDWTWTGLKDCAEHWTLLGVVLAFETILRLISFVTRNPDGSSRYPLLAPTYFCMITPFFYVILFIVGIDIHDAQEAGYFFPPLDSGSTTTWVSSVFNKDVWDMWRVVSFRTISWTAVYKSIPTLIGLTAFSLIHVPINIPAFAVSTDVESDMNNELVSHGYSNALAGIFGGLQNYMCYSNSVAYAKSGGTGRASSLCVTLLTVVLFFVGPSIAAFTPRCMAGTLLIHLGLELFIEGAFEPYGNYDSLEYFGIWLIVAIMTWFGMSAALIAGAVSAVTTFVVQSIGSKNPVRGSFTASGICSSKQNRRREATAILENRHNGRRSIYIFQLQGHIFFGNISQLTEKVRSTLERKRQSRENIRILIMDFSNVIGMDSSAAQAVTKIKKMIHKDFGIPHAIYVTGLEGFPCQFDLSAELTRPANQTGSNTHVPMQTPIIMSPRQTLARTPLQMRGMTPRGTRAKPSGGLLPKRGNIPADKVCETLDSALLLAEDALIARVDRSLLRDRITMSMIKLSEVGADSEGEDNKLAFQCLSDLCPGEYGSDVRVLLSTFKKEIWYEGQIIWKQGSASNCAKLILRGTLTSAVEDGARAASEEITAGVMVGQLGLVAKIERLSTVTCRSESCVVYSLERGPWEELVMENPKVARFIDMIALRDLSHRAQQVNNRTSDACTLPV